MNKYRVEMKIRRRIKLMRTAPPTEKMRWAGYILMVMYVAITYLKGAGLWP